ncbi:MAG: lysophospholipid acyltransferase family protein [Chloroflexota bacterium]
MKLSQRIVRGMVRALLRPFLICEVRGRENIPASGPAIIVSNHVEWLEPPLIGSYCGHWVHFVAKVQLLHYPVLGRIIRWAEVVPLDRSAGVAETRQMMVKAGELLERGLLVCLFPEGRRSRKPGLQQGHSGPVSLAVRAGVPLIPVGISGTDKVNFRRLPWEHRARVVLNIGRQFTLPAGGDKGSRQASTSLMMQEIARLLPQEYRGQYGD